MMFCLFHGQAVKFKLHLEGNLLCLGLTMETSHYLYLYFWYVWMAQILIAGQTGEIVIALSIALHFFALAVPLLSFLCRVSKYLCRYVNQGDKNDRKLFFFSSFWAIILCFIADYGDIK